MKHNIDNFNLYTQSIINEMVESKCNNADIVDYVFEYATPKLNVFEVLSIVKYIEEERRRWEWDDRKAQKLINRCLRKGKGWVGYEENRY